MIAQTRNLPAASLEPFRQRWALWVVLAVILLMAGVRLRLLGFPLERDEGEYAYAGQLLLEGVPPYQLACNMKFPGTYVAYALLMKVFGQTPEGIHFGILCVTTLTTLLLFGLGNRLLDETTGLVAATTYCLLAAAPGMMGLQGHATHFAALFATAGLALLWPARMEHGWLRALGGGLMFGLAVLMKQHAGILCLWALAFLAIPRLKRKDEFLPKKFGYAAGLVAGIVLPFCLTCLIIWRAGVFSKFWFWTITYAGEYARLATLSRGWTNLLAGLRFVLPGTFCLGLVALAGTALIWFDERLRSSRVALAGFAVASFLTVAPGLYFREHYYLLSVPAVALLAGCAVSGAGRKWRRLGERRLPGSWPVWFFAMAAALTLWLNGACWFRLPLAEVVQRVYPQGELFETQAVADVIRSVTTPDARVAVLGSEPQIYFLSRRRSATGCLYMYPLMEPHPFARRMQEEMIREIETARPRLIIFMLDSWSWLLKPESETKILDWWTDSYRTNYIPVGLVETKANEPTRYVWGAENVAPSKAPTRGILLYQRRDELLSTPVQPPGPPAGAP